MNYTRGKGAGVLTIKPVKATKERRKYDSGMSRNSDEGKPKLGLMIPKDIPYEHLWTTQLGHLLRLGAEIHGPRNWEKANSKKEMEDFQESALRHLTQAIAGEEDENHLAAVLFNVIAWMTTKYKIEVAKVAPERAIEEIYGDWDDFRRSKEQEKKE